MSGTLLAASAYSQFRNVVVAEFILQQTLSDSVANDYIGAEVEVFDDVFVTVNINRDYAYIYRYYDNNWFLERTLPFYNPGKIALEKNILFTSMARYNYVPAVGLVKTYRYINSVWTLSQLITPIKSTNNECFGSSVHYDGTTLTVGAPGLDNTDMTGRVYVYRLESQSTRNGVYFDGTGDYLTATHSTAFQFGTADHTIEFWMYALDSFSNRGFFQFSDTVGGLQSNTVSGSYHAGHNDQDFINSFVSSASFFDLIANNCWTHIAIVRQSTTVNFYLNGTLIFSMSNYSTSLNFTNLAIGGYVGFNNLFRGYISDFRVVKGTAVYTGHFTPSTTPLTAIPGTTLLTCNSAGITDSSTNNMSITVVGDATWGTPASPSQIFVQKQVFPGPTYATQFNGKYSMGSPPYTDVFLQTNWYTGAEGNPWTLEFWVATDGSNGFPVISTYYYPDNFNINNEPPYTAISIANGVLYIGNKNLNGWAYVVGKYPANPVISGGWTHIAINYSNKQFKIFKNGTLFSQSDTNIIHYSPPSPIPLIIGNTGYSSSYFRISNLRLVTGVAVYTSDFTPSTTLLTKINGTQFLLFQTPTHGDLDGSYVAPTDFTVTTKSITQNGITYSWPIITTDSPFSMKNDYFGNTVSNDGNVLVVGAKGAVSKSTVWIYTRQNANSDFTLARTIPTTSSLTQGVTVDVSNNVVVVGESATTSQPQKGNVYIYELVNNNWSLTQTLFTGQSNDLFGWNVRIKNSELVISAQWSTITSSPNGGTVYYYKLITGSYTEQGQILQPRIISNEQFGFSVAIGNDIVVVGAPGVSPGKVYVFEKFVDWTKWANNSSFFNNTSWSSNTAIMDDSPQPANSWDYWDPATLNTVNLTIPSSAIREDSWVPTTWDYWDLTTLNIANLAIPSSAIQIT